ncbi:MAG: heavy-metal-associated domain-containing protein [Coriobacteriales bacterium]|nr:heavy-metal-associated domain-containing protein [Coriobacteriales bacterium]
MKKVFKLEGEICSNCAAKIENGIQKLDGVQSVHVNALTLKWTLEADDDKFDGIVSESIKIFNKVEPDCEVIR